MSNDIVVGIDGSANSRRALTWALDEAQLRDCRVRAGPHLVLPRRIRNHTRAEDL